MKRIFLEEISENVEITGKDANHLANSLRAKKGDKIIAVDKFGNTATLELTDFDSETIYAKRISEIKPAENVRKYITLADCLPKQNKFDTIVEKATELGVDKLEPLISDRTIARPGNFRAKTKLERWQRVAKEAAEQCARDTLPEIGNIQELTDWLAKISPALGNFENGKFNGQGALLLFCYEKETEDNLSEILGKYKNFDGDKNIIILIGPEGGFSEREVREIKNCGGVSVSLGKTVLKTDTAAISALAIVQYELN
ncbi:MAG: 16S rRNA (uracil(1498)-N(3))-methyltransferase [Selenomonadaceae bacterium]|nr:16S rRNA (uracil(1498)-N(3))-methyltransferase [Selenomonadaceae bacterium]